MNKKSKIKSKSLKEPLPVATLSNKEGVTLDYLVVVCIYSKYAKQALNLLNSVKDLNLPARGKKHKWQIYNK